MHHIDGRAALLKISASDEVIFRAIELKVMHVVEQLRAAGAPISEFEWSRKPRDSQVTKLLAKRSSLASSIYDKLRFRLIVPNYNDVTPMLAMLLRQLVPFNYLVPGEVVNTLVDLDGIIDEHPHLAKLAPHLQFHGVRTALPASNEFSAPDYRIINFIADLPVRVDQIMPDHDLPSDLSHVVFALTEFQICDKATALKNESGVSSHDAYKNRQHERVKARLFRDEHDPLLPE